MFLGGSLGRFSSRCLNHNHFYWRWWGNWCWWRNNFWLSRWRCWFRSTFYIWWRQRCCLSRWSRCRCKSCCWWCRRCRSCWRRWVSSNLSPETLNYCVGDLDHSCSLCKHGMSPTHVCSVRNCKSALFCSNNSHLIIDNSDLPGTLVGTHLDQESSLSLFTNLTSTLIWSQDNNFSLHGNFKP